MGLCGTSRITFASRCPRPRSGPSRSAASPRRGGALAGPERDESEHGATRSAGMLWAEERAAGGTGLTAGKHPTAVRPRSCEPWLHPRVREAPRQRRAGGEARRPGRPWSSTGTSRRSTASAGTSRNVSQGGCGSSRTSSSRRQCRSWQEAERGPQAPSPERLAAGTLQRDGVAPCACRLRRLRDARMARRTAHILGASRHAIPRRRTIATRYRASRIPDEVACEIVHKLGPLASLAGRTDAKPDSAVANACTERRYEGL